MNEWNGIGFVDDFKLRFFLNDLSTLLAAHIVMPLLLVIVVVTILSDNSQSLPFFPFFGSMWDGGGGKSRYLIS